MSSERSRRGRGKAGRGGSRSARSGEPAGGEGSSRKASGNAAGRTGRPSKGKKGKRSGGGVSRERSAGGVVVREGEVVVIVPTRRASDGSKVLALPKGHIDPGETPLQAALREVREETGVVGEHVSELGETRYWYRRDGRTIPKSVSFFLLRYVEGDTSEHDDEVEDARWLPLRRALSELSHAAEREMVARALAYLEAERKDR